MIRKQEKLAPITHSKLKDFENELDTEAKRCFATHDEDIYYFNMRIYYFNRMRIYSTVQLCSITSLWHSGQHLCRAGCRFESLWGFGFYLKGAHYEMTIVEKKTYLAGLQCTLTSSCAKMN